MLFILFLRIIILILLDTICRIWVQILSIKLLMVLILVFLALIVWPIVFFHTLIHRNILWLIINAIILEMCLRVIIVDFACLIVLNRLIYLILGIHYHVLRLEICSIALWILVKWGLVCSIIKWFGIPLAILYHHLNLLVHVFLIFLFLFILFILLQAHFDVVA